MDFMLTIFVGVFFIYQMYLEGQKEEIFTPTIAEENHLFEEEESKLKLTWREFKDQGDLK